MRAKETLASVARRYKISTADLMAWNNLSSPVVRPGTILTIPSPGSNPSAAPASHPVRSKAAHNVARRKSPASPRAAVVYKVRKGESLAQIAANHNISVEALTQKNSHLGETLRIGAEIIIPAVK